MCLSGLPHIHSDHRPISFFPPSLVYRIKTYSALPAPLFRRVIRSVTGAGYYGSRVTDGTGRLVLSTVGGLRVCTGSARIAVSTLLPRAMESDQRVPGEAKGGNLTQVSRWLYANTQDCLFL